MTNRLNGAADLKERAHQLLQQACDNSGLDSGGAQLLRLRSNAVFRLRAPIVVRIATAPTAATRLPAVLAVTRWLAAQGFPTVTPVDDIPGQPHLIADVAVTFWHYIPQGTPPATTTELGHLLRALHEMPPPPTQLRRLEDPLASVRANLHSHPEALTPRQRTWLHDQLDELTQTWQQLPFTAPETLIHGDAWIDNLIRHTNGSAILADWDSVALGPREWDLIHSHHGHRRFGLTQTDVNDFTTAYGHDLRDWPGYNDLMRIRDLYAIGIHIRNASGDPFSRHELNRRLNSLTSGTTHDRWYLNSRQPDTSEPADEDSNR